MIKLLLVAALIAGMLVPLLFIWHKVYKDGVLGRIGLGGVSLFSFIHLARMIEGRADDLPLEIAWLIISCAAFLVWHLVRFHRRVLRAKAETHGAFLRGEA